MDIRLSIGLAIIIYFDICAYIYNNISISIKFVCYKVLDEETSIHMASTFDFDPNKKKQNSTPF